MSGELKAIYVAEFRRDMTREQAGRYWTDVHAPLADPLDGMVRYVQNHVVGPLEGRDEDPAATGFDGYACEWWRDRASFETGMATAAWAAVVADGAEFLELGSLAGMSVVVEEHVVRDGPTAPFKLAFLVRFKEGLTRQQAARHWLDVHGPLALRVPGLVRHVQNLVSGAIGERGAIGPAAGARFDGLAELWFEDGRALALACEGAAADALRRDSLRFLDTAAGAHATVEERVIKSG